MNGHCFKPLGFEVVYYPTKANGCISPHSFHPHHTHFLTVTWIQLNCVPPTLWSCYSQYFGALLRSLLNCEPLVRHSLHTILLFNHSVCLTLHDPVDCRTPGFPVLHHLPELAQTHVHWVGDECNCAVVWTFLALPSFGIGSSFSILALRSPWTVWEGKMIGHWKSNPPGW